MNSVAAEVRVTIRLHDTIRNVILLTYAVISAKA